MKAKSHEVGVHKFSVVMRNEEQRTAITRHPYVFRAGSIIFFFLRTKIKKLVISFKSLQKNSCKKKKTVI